MFQTSFNGKEALCQLPAEDAKQKEQEAEVLSEKETDKSFNNRHL